MNSASWVAALWYRSLLGGPSWLIPCGSGGESGSWPGWVAKWLGGSGGPNHKVAGWVRWAAAGRQSRAPCPVGLAGLGQGDQGWAMGSAVW